MALFSDLWISTVGDNGAMAAPKTVYTCSACGGTNPKWLGRCPHCEAWNTLEEGVGAPTGAAATKNRFQSLAKSQPVATLADIDATDVAHIPTGIDELDRVLGGGIVSGGVVLIGGDPGIGKSTLLLQAIDALATQMKVLYVTGEESSAQLALRSRRLDLSGANVRVLAEINLERILATIEAEQPSFCVIDSIQTLYSEQLTSAPGSVAQVRECSAQLTRTAKSGGCTIVLVGHVTKDRGCWSTSSTRCCTSRATRIPASAWCVPSRIASARSTRSACSP